MVLNWLNYLLRITLDRHLIYYYNYSWKHEKKKKKEQVVKPALWNNYPITKSTLIVWDWLSNKMVISLSLILIKVWRYNKKQSFNDECSVTNDDTKAHARTTHKAMKRLYVSVIWLLLIKVLFFLFYEKYFSCQHKVYPIEHRVPRGQPKGVGGA